MAIFISEFDDFVFDRGAVTRTAAVNLTAVHRSAMQVVANQIVHLRIGISDPTRHLLDRKIITEKRKWLWGIVAGLNFGFAVVDGPTVEPRRRAGFESLKRKPQSVQRSADAR